MNLCAACPIRLGECPYCGTFWTRNESGKTYGVRRTDNPGGVANGPTNGGPLFLNLLPNVISGQIPRGT